MNLLVTGAFGWTDDELSDLKLLGHNIVFMQQEGDALPCEYGWVEGIIGNGIFLSHPIERFVNLKYIQLTSAGFDRVPLDYIKGRNIELYNARGVYSVPMAEFALCGVLELYKQSRFFANNQKLHIWEKHRGLRELCGKTVCIIGCGSVGNECAARFKGFGCDIIGVDSDPYDNGLYRQMLSIEALDDALKVSDIVVLTLPLTDNTRRLFDKKRFSLIKRGGVLINLSRGNIVDTAALTAALGDNLSGAVLDVFEQEPLEASSPLWDMENVIITPHNSFVGEGNHGRMLNAILLNLKKH